MPYTVNAPFHSKRAASNLLAMRNNTKTHSPARVVTCTLKFPDGCEISGRVREVAERPRSPMVFVGDVSRLGMACALGTGRDLRRLFQRIAKNSGATLIESRTTEAR